MIFVQHESASWLGLSDSFWGSLSGALITGIIAIVVFVIGSIIENKRRRKVIKNYVETIKEIHSNTICDLRVFLEASKPKVDLPKDYQDKIVYLVINGKMLNYFDMTEMMRESKVAIHVMEYVQTYQETVQLIESSHSTRYGNLFFKFINNEDGKNDPEMLEFYINNLYDIIKKIK
ncbi:hypothetical protein [Planococcus citreus]|uniref:Uncharacterized protein n=1 Tax=Planococcus citreus TaxID=1373 RepID=A0A497YSB5_9BACL|nr:hypothetical protein [Planococcus citreus]RLJ89914.1 hypothetical protein DFR62_0054 [Planococcus citreus]